MHCYGRDEYIFKRIPRNRAKAFFPLLVVQICSKKYKLFAEISENIPTRLLTHNLG
jgi:hypothetical protein